MSNLRSMKNAKAVVILTSMMIRLAIVPAIREKAKSIVNIQVNMHVWTDTIMIHQTIMTVMAIVVRQDPT